MMRLILFDIDGTLICTKGVGRESTRAAMLEVFGTASRIETHVFGGKTDWLTLVELLSDHGYDSDMVGQIMPLYEQTIRRHLSDLIARHDVSPCSGALEVVQDLRHQPDKLLGLVTGNVSTTAPLKLRAAGFDPDWFPVGAYGSEAMDRNALPALALERAVRHTGRVISPADVIVIGDTVADIHCARALGGVAVAVCTGYENRADLSAARPDYLLDDLTHLHTIL